MRTFFVLCLVALVSANLEIENALSKGTHPLSKEMVDLINRSNASWTVSLTLALKNKKLIFFFVTNQAKHHFKEHELQDVKNKLGTFLDHDLPDVYNDDPFNSAADIPEEFDARKQWPKCANIISDIRDQGKHFKKFINLTEED